MTNKTVMDRIDSIKRSERTPLLESAGMSESLINRSIRLPAEPIPTGVSWGVAAFLLVNTALGAGMLNYPYAYNQIGGVLAAALMQIVLLVFITSTMFILVYCADFNQDNTYHDVLLSMCGKRAQQVSALSILLTCYGINITFLVIIGDQYDRIFNSLLSDYLSEYWFLDRKFTIFVTSVLFIWPMCYAKRLDFLRHASVLGMFAMLYVAFLTVYEHYRLDDIDVATISTTTDLNSSTTDLSSLQTRSVMWFEPIAIIPVLCFAYQTHEVIVPVYSCMKQRHIGHFMKASITGLIILFFLYNLVGAFGYLTFGANVGPDIMSLYDAKDPVVVIGIVALVVKFITTYPPLMFCGRGALDGLYGEMRKLSHEEFESSEKTRRIVISTVWFFSTVALAVFAPDISVTLQLLGSMASINVFVFPGMCLVSLTKRLRQARLMLMINDKAHPNQQRAKDYYLISGSYFGKQRKNSAIKAENFTNQHQQHQALLNGNNLSLSNRQHFTATFASLIEFENDATKYGEQSGNGLVNGDEHSQKINGYGSNLKPHPSRAQEFHNNLSNGSSSFREHSLFRISDSLNDYSDLGTRKQNCDNVNQIMRNNNGYSNSTNCASRRLTSDTEFNISYINKDLSLDTSARHTNYNQLRQQSLQNSWHNRSTTESILERLGSSIAPSAVAQVGISRLTAAGLYFFSAILITFGTFIFVLELVTVFGII